MTDLTKASEADMFRAALECDRRQDEWATTKRGEPPVRLGDVLTTIVDSLA